MNDFDKAPIRGEGMGISYGDCAIPTKPAIETTWIEFSLPKAWEAECQQMIADWLEIKGFINE